MENPNAAVGDKYFKGTGTSMSSAVTAGAVAALVSERGGLVPDDVKRLLMGTAFASDVLSTKTGAGMGELDLAQALAADVDATPKLRYHWDSTQYGPAEGDADLWAAFGAAWEAGDLRAAVGDLGLDVRADTSLGGHRLVPGCHDQRARGTGGWLRRSPLGRAPLGHGRLERPPLGRQTSGSDVAGRPSTGPGAAGPATPG